MTTIQQSFDTCSRKTSSAQEKLVRGRDHTLMEHMQFKPISLLSSPSLRPSPRNRFLHILAPSRAHSSGRTRTLTRPRTGRRATEKTELRSERAASPAAASTTGWGWEAGASWERGGRSASCGSAPWAAPRVSARS
jgi:hypothetical protein